MSMSKERTTQTIKFLKWTKKYNGWWKLICEPDNENMNFSMMKLLIEELEKESFYEIIFVLLFIHKKQTFMNDTFETLLTDLLIAQWKVGNKDDTLKGLIDSLE